MFMLKKRLDVFLTANGFIKGRDHAKELVKSGGVLVDGKVVTVPSFLVDEPLITLLEEQRFVGRGGYKLEAALKHFEIDVEGLVCLDIGASTGGFTDCLLQNRAKKVYAVDVGTGQFAESLLCERVVLLENTDIRNIDALPEQINFACIDVSFISALKVLPAVFNLVKGNIVCLIKPQFEIGRGNKNKKGVVTDLKLREQTVKDVMENIKLFNKNVEGPILSPIKGQNGNIEYLVLITDKII